MKVGDRRLLQSFQPIFGRNRTKAMKFIIIGMKKLCSRRLAIKKRIGNLDQSLMVASKDFRHGGLLMVDSVSGSLCNTEERSKEPSNFVHPMIDLCLVSGAIPPLVKHASCFNNQLKQPILHWVIVFSLIFHGHACYSPIKALYSKNHNPLTSLSTLGNSCFNCFH